MISDEQRLLRAMQTRCNNTTPRTAGRAFGFSGKRVKEICRKWVARGWYTTDSADDLGKLTPAGLAVEGD